MDELMLFAAQYKILTILLVIFALFPSVLIARKLELIMGSQLYEAFGERNNKQSLYCKCKNAVSNTIKEYERKEKKAGFYVRAKSKMRKAGYTSEYAPTIYIFLKYVLTVAVFLIGIASNYPDIARALVLSVFLVIIIEMVITSEKRKINLKFQKYIYKIYKYLHNQISSGVKVTEAVKTAYEVVDDKQLRNILIRLAARYELTLDIDNALEDFRSNFDIHEAETLCVALKQGVETGDNQELLARQEDVMFKKYFNFIQAETDGCKTRSLFAVAMFTAIVVIMILVPLFNDMSNAVSKIFVT